MSKVETEVKSENDMPVMVSVCVVTYNHGKYIGTCLDHILGQNRDFRIEVLIHDDASTDNAQEVIRSYQERYPDIIKPILRTENQYSKGITNISGAFNFPRAKGKYVALTDGDDYWCDPDKLKKQVEYMEANPGCVFTFHSAKVVTEDGSLVNGELMRPYKQSRVVKPEELVDKTVGSPFASFLLRREIVEKLPDYYVDCPVGDRPLELMAAAAGDSYYFDEPMSVYRFSIGGSWTQSQMTGDYVKKQKKFALDLFRMYRSFDEETGGRFHDAAMRAARRNEFLTNVNVRDFKEIYKAENKEFYSELNFRDRFFIGFEYRMPGLYTWLRNRKNGRK